MSVVEFALLIMAIIFIAVMSICSIYKTTAIQDAPSSDTFGSTQRCGAGWFTSALVTKQADGTTVVDSSRRHRKGLGPELSARIRHRDAG